MAQIEQSRRTVAPRFDRQPFSTGGGYAAPGRALQDVASGLNKLASVGNALQAQHERDEDFQFKADLQRFRNGQEQKYTGFKGEYQGNGQDFSPSVMQGYDKDWSEFVTSKVPERLKGQAELYGERFRGDFAARSMTHGQSVRGEWYVREGTSLFTTTILPRVTGDVRSVQQGLDATDGLIGSMDGVPPRVADGLRQKAATQIFKRWLSQAGPDASDDAAAIIEQYRMRTGTREGAAEGSFRAAQEGQTIAGANGGGPIHVYTARVPSSAERRAIFRKGGVVINLDTNWSKGGATNPMIVIPDNATPEQREAARSYTQQLALVYKQALGRDVQPIVVTRAQNGRGRAATIHTEPFAVTDPAAVEYFRSGSGLRRHAQIIRDTLGKIPGAHFSIPHNPDKGDSGAEGSGTNEVELARALIGELTGTAVASSTQVAGDVTSRNLDIARTLTTRDYFAQLLQENLPKIERTELRMMRKQEEMAADQRKALEEKTRTAAYDLAFERKLTPEWIDANRENLTDRAYIELKKMITPMGRTTEPETLAKLLEEAPDLPYEAIAEANAAYARGDLTYDDYRVVVSQARGALKSDARQPEFVRGFKEQLRETFRPRGRATAETWGEYGSLVKRFNRFVDQEGDKLTEDSLKKYTERLIEDEKVRHSSTQRMRLEMPSGLPDGVTRGTMNLDVVKAAAVELAQRFRAGQIDRDDYLAEGRKLKAWQDLINRETEMFEAMQRPEAGKFSMPVAPGGAVQSMTQDAGGTTATRGLDVGNPFEDAITPMFDMPDGAEWSFLPPMDGEQMEGTSFLPVGRYRRPDGSVVVAPGLPQPLLDAYRAMEYTLGDRQDPAAPEGYVSQNALQRGAEGLAGSAAVGSLGVRAPAGALRSGAARNAGDLDPSPAARMARAREMGFGDDVWYHGTATDDAITSFKSGMKGNSPHLEHETPAIFFSKDPSLANQYARSTGDARRNALAEKLANEERFDEAQALYGTDTRPIMQRAREFANMALDVLPDDIRRSLEPMVTQFRHDSINRQEVVKAVGSDKAKRFFDLLEMSKNVGSELADNAAIYPVKLPQGMREIDANAFGGQFNAIIYDRLLKEAKEAGAPGITIKNVVDSPYGIGDPTTIAAVFNPRNIRSVNAMFDPSKSDSANLLAANRSQAAAPGQILAQKNAARGAGDLDPSAPGIRAYHGTPHDVDRFDMSKIGTGEGGQAFGYGLYFAENQAVAGQYRRTVKGNDYANVKAPITDIVHKELGEDFGSFTMSKISGVLDSMRSGKTIREALEENSLTGDSVNGQIGRIVERELAKRGNVAGNLYEVDIKVKPEQLLDWDKPLSEQPGAISTLVGKKLEQLLDEPGPQLNQLYDDFISGKMTGEQAYRLLSGGNPAAASDALRKAGIPGIRYLDQGSRGAGEGTRNLVIFDDSLVNIVKKNGEPLTKEEREEVLRSIMGMPPGAASEEDREQ